LRRGANVPRLHKHHHLAHQTHNQAHIEGRISV